MNEIIYTMYGGYRLPNLLPTQEPEVCLGKYALLRKEYLKQSRRVCYINLLTSGKVNEHLLEIELTAQAQMERITSDMAKAQGVTETLKATDQMKWVRMMNNIRQAAEEIVLRELVYS